MPAEEHPGQWWLPESPDRKVPGVLSIDDRGEVRLSLIGELRQLLAFAERTDQEDGSTRFSVTEQALDAAGTYPRVLGQSASHAFTLEDGFRTRHRSTLFGTATEEIHFSQCFKGVWFEPGEALTFDRVRFTLQWLTAWIGRTGFSEHIETTNDLGAVIVRRAQVQPRRRVRLGDGLTLFVTHRVGTRGDRITEAAVTQHFAFELRSVRKRPLDELMTITSRLQALVGIGTDRVAGYVDIQLAHPDLTHGPPSAPRKYRRDIAYRGQWRAYDSKHTAEPHQHEMPFTLEHLGGAQALARWLNVSARYGHQLDMVMSTRHVDGLVTDKLIYRVAALEGLHKIQHPHRTALVERLKACAALAGQPFRDLVGDVDRWAQAAKDQRNHIGHGSHPGEVEAVSILLLADAAYWLFVMCLLREMDAPAVVTTRLVDTASFSWLREQFQRRGF